MFIAWLQFFANLIIALAVLRIVTVKLAERNPDSGLTKALAFLC